ncbi:hypothetical protein CHGG_05888 [Chaetomium globosum CBS 148.51]|uniref:3-carboxymuconate cyclase n=1 Tax=Chaetomium globosum (strain ATCC 6205 / CBS 148.51 / DSM 1962 / NBRC 6347 / NRRL 1970) TaxID=306901 RepID=Q2H627_CHAGB|nr:uncharacterized protein CHGG_05888 [Chaetomium globosum CBS 148.51]EAQ89269.1 hypothetical protein CHGG_05888 [Chaetomium globosum CBS 148.51]
MPFISRSWLPLAALLSLTPGAISAVSPRGHPAGPAPVGKAIYILTNDESNAVVALPIGPDGKLSAGTVTATDGAGSIALNADNQPATPDALVGQSSLTIAGNVSPSRLFPQRAKSTNPPYQSIFAVNAGSNTLSMLTISRSDPTKLTAVGKPVAIPAEFPNTVGASAKHGLACVGASGATAGIACSAFSPARGLGPMDALRPYDLGQTTPPVGPTNTVSHVFFSDDETALFVTVKGDPPTNKTGFFSRFPVTTTGGGNGGCGQKPPKKGGNRASVSMTEQRSVPKDTLVLFGSQPVPGTHDVFATDAGFGAAVLRVDPQSGEAATVAVGTIEGQAATCWVALSPATGTAFVTDFGVNRLVEMSVADAKVVSTLDLSANGDMGLTDVRVAGNFVYALAPGNGTTQSAITVVDVSGGPGSAVMVQHFSLDGFADHRAVGMTVLV